MKELLLQYALYHSWANGLLLETVDKLPADLQNREVNSSFSSIYKTILHMWNAESVWWQRMKLQERITEPNEFFAGTTKELISNLLLQNAQWQEWIANAQAHMLQHEFIYKNSKKESFKQPVFQVLLHVFNHGTYHRGQIVNMLRQVGVDKIPQTDYIFWSRTEANKKSKVDRRLKD